MDAVIDIETLSIRAAPAIVSVAAVPIEFGQPMDLSKAFYRVIDIEDAMRHGSVDAPTLRWWLGQGNNAREAISEPGESAEEVLEDLARWFDQHDIQHVWSEGPSFDMAHLAELYRKIGHEPMWKYQNERCCRTALAMWDPQSACREVPVIPHHALYDAIATGRSLLEAYTLSLQAAPRNSGVPV